MTAPSLLRVWLLVLGLVGLSLMPCGRAWAAHEGADKTSDHAPEGAAENGGNSRNINIPVLIAPVVDGKTLVGYLYISLRLTTADSDVTEHVRDVLPLVQDSLLRALNDAPIRAADATTQAGRDAVLKTATAALGALSDTKGITSIAVTEVQSVPF